MNLRLGSAALFCLLLSAAAPVLADVEVTYVGDNPFANLGFPSTGGTGMIAGQQPGTATLEKTFTSLGDVPIIIDGGPTPTSGMDFIHIDERVRNNTGVDWTDFHLLMQPIDADPALQVEFQNVANPTGEFGSIMPMTNALWLVGNVPNGGIFSLSFDLKISSPPDAFFLFGLHEYPTVPEPSTLVLIGCSLLGFAGLSRRRG